MAARPNQFDQRILAVGHEPTHMATVTKRRVLDAPPETVRELILADVPAFIRASGFDEVEVAEDRYVVSRTVGLATFELELERVDTDRVLALDQTTGIFDEMWTEYRVDPIDRGEGAHTADPSAGGAGAVVIAETEFTLGGVLGPVLDETMITARRTEEFEKQFDYLEERIASTV